MGKPIYHIEAKATIIKNKRPQTRSVWIVSTYDNPLEIMRYDKRTMTRLTQELVSAKAKNKAVLIESIDSIKQIGTTNYE
tara:strand:- start:34 stop:273 length:240 start_codon:yes stop_codon:yes gene_type:complete